MRAPDFVDIPANSGNSKGGKSVGGDPGERRLSSVRNQVPAHPSSTDVPDLVRHAVEEELVVRDEDDASWKFTQRLCQRIDGTDVKVVRGYPLIVITVLRSKTSVLEAETGPSLSLGTVPFAICC